MNWFVWIIIVALTLAFVLVRYVMSTALRTENPVGFKMIQIPHVDGLSFTACLWYPTQVKPKPTTMLSYVLMDVARNAPISGHALPLVVSRTFAQYRNIVPSRLSSFVICCFRLSLPT
jgi:hypothetical protein